MQPHILGWKSFFFVAELYEIFVLAIIRQSILVESSSLSVESSIDATCWETCESYSEVRTKKNE